jgi:hypothetical protein
MEKTKMRKTIILCLTVLVLEACAYAQTVSSCKIPVNLERLAAKASEVVDVNMDANMLKFAGNFLNKEKSDESQAQKLLTGLKALCVRSFEFDKDGQYAEQDVEELRAQLQAPAWSRMVGVRSKRDGENVDVYFRMEKGSITGLAVIAAEPKEFTFVHIDGLITPEQLAGLGGQFGIPKVEMPVKPAGKAESK